MLEINFSPFPILETERLILKRITLNDTAVMYEMRSSTEVMKYIPRPLAQTQEDAKKHIQLVDEQINLNKCINWGIYLKNTNQMIGTIGYPGFQLANYRAEVGYLSLSSHRSKGYMTEALNKVIEYGFTTIKLHSIEAVVDPKNISSIRVLEKCGFDKEAHFKENEFYNGQFLDTVVYSKLNK